MKRALFFIICFIVLSVFIYNKTYISKNKDNTKLEIYLVADNATSASRNKNIDDIPVEQNPVITDKDIEKYIWNEQKVNKRGISKAEKVICILIIAHNSEDLFKTLQ